MNFNFPLILASRSPRRQELLAGLGIPFEVRAVAVDENYPADMSPQLVPGYLARKKAEAAADMEKESLIIAADTVVILNNSVLGKPHNPEQAKEFLQQLSGQQHLVVTGVCIKYRDKLSLFKDVTQVSFAALSDSEIDHYVKTCSPLDKAGAYGIQEWIGMIGITGIKGSYFNVVGLPLHKLYQELKKFQV